MPNQIEPFRLSILRDFPPIDDNGTRQLDRIAKLAARLCGTPIALVSLVDEAEQHFIGRAGAALAGTPRSQSFCAFAMMGQDVFIVPDASQDPRFAANPLVTGDPHIRFYAGYPLVSIEGVPLGSLCVIDNAARPEGLTDEQREGLETLAELVMTLLESWRAKAHRLSDQNQSDQIINELQRKFDVLADALPQLVWSTPADGMSDFFNRHWCEFTGAEESRSFGAGWLDFLHPEDAPVAQHVWEKAVSDGRDYEVRYRLRRHDGQYRWVVARGLPIFDPAGDIVRWIGTCTDIHDEIENADRLDLLSQELSHRIKNVFAVIAGLVSLTSRSHPESAEFANDLYERVLALGRAHSFVSSKAGQDSPHHVDLRGLLGQLLAPYSDGVQNRLTVSGGDCPIDDRSATPLALFFHELATNSAKYGAFSGHGGEVRIAISGTDPVVIEWHETSTRAMTEPSKSGFGSRLIDLSIKRQLGGELQRTWDGNALAVVAKVPAASLVR